MQPRYRHENPKDEHHANAAFGQEMIREIESWCLGRDRAQAPGPGARRV